MTRITLHSFKNALPDEGKHVLLYWDASDHFEDGAVYSEEFDGDWYHVLFDGESLNCNPTHWAELPEFKKV